MAGESPPRKCIDATAPPSSTALIAIWSSVVIGASSPVSALRDSDRRLATTARSSAGSPRQNATLSVTWPAATLSSVLPLLRSSRNGSRAWNVAPQAPADATTVVDSTSPT